MKIVPVNCRSTTFSVQYLAMEQNTQPTAEEIAAQLRKPSGENGQYVAEHMANSNVTIVNRMYERLELKQGFSMLEIGMANGAHISKLFGRQADLKYVGLDYSSEMVKEAQVLNAELVSANRAVFIDGSVANIPSQDDSFHAVCSSNTLYFWPDPEANMKEIHRVLKPNGQLVLGIRTKGIMDKMEITKHGFTTYNPDDATQLMKDAGFREVTFDIMAEEPRELMDVTYEIDGCYLVGRK